MDEANSLCITDGFMQIYEHYDARSHVGPHDLHDGIIVPSPALRSVLSYVSAQPSHFYN